MSAERVLGGRGGGRGKAPGPLAGRVPGAGRRGPAPSPAARRRGCSHAARRRVAYGAEPGLVAAGPERRNYRPRPSPGHAPSQSAAGRRRGMTHIHARRGAPRRPPLGWAPGGRGRSFGRGRQVPRSTLRGSAPLPGPRGAQPRGGARVRTGQVAQGSVGLSSAPGP